MAESKIIITKDLMDKVIEELTEYRAIGTIGELKEAKIQYDNINAAAKKVALIELCGFETAKEAVITEIKRSRECSLKEYQEIGTVEEFKALKEKSEPMKPAYQGEHEKCPTCGSFGVDVYCAKCGQKIDWRE